MGFLIVGTVILYRKTRDVRAEIDFYQTKLTRARTYSYIIIFPLLIYKLVLFIDLSQ